MGIDDENRLGLDLIVAITDTVAPKPNTRDTLVRAKRTLRLLSDCNATLVHACTEAELLAKNCQLIVTVGGYRLVWVGYAQQDAEKSVCPVAQFGFNQGYIDKLLISWHDTERGRGPTGTAIRLGKTQVARDILRAPQFAPWRENARVHGFASSIALPLQRAGETFGALNIYANEADAFDQEEIRLLEELAGNLAYGISAFRLQEEHTAVLHDARRRDYICRAVVEQSVEGIVIAGRDGRVVMVNPAYCQMTGYSQEELSRHQPLDAVHSNVAPLFRSLDVVHQGGVFPTLPNKNNMILRNSFYKSRLCTMLAWPRLGSWPRGLCTRSIIPIMPSCSIAICWPMLGKTSTSYCVSIFEKMGIFRLVDCRFRKCATCCPC